MDRTALRRAGYRQPIHLAGAEYSIYCIYRYNYVIRTEDGRSNVWCVSV